MRAKMAKIKLRYVNEYRDHTGKVRRYFRKGGVRKMLPGLPGSAEFMSAYQAFLAEQPIPPKPHATGSFAQLVTDFYGSNLFLNLNPNSRRIYRSALDPLAKEHGHRGVSSMTAEAVERILTRIGVEHPAMGNLTRAVLRRLMGLAVKRRLLPANPVTGIELFNVGEHHTWTDAELRKFEKRWPLGTRERLAYALLLWTGQRVGDVAKMTRADISDGMVYVEQEKTGAKLWVPIMPELAAAMQAYETNGLALIGKRNGQPMKQQGLSGLMAKAISKADLPPRCVAHGLRKARMRLMAEAGATASQIAAVSGHKTLREVERYTKAADQKQLARAGMNKGRTDSDTTASAQVTHLAENKAKSTT